MRLTFEISEDGDFLEVHGDSEGLIHLCAHLTSLVQKELRGTTHDDIHLLAPSWGGSGIDDITVGLRNRSLKSVKIFRWADGVLDEN